MNTNAHLTVLGAVGLCEALNGSLLTLSGLTDRTQLTLHLGQLLLQLLHKKRQTESKSKSPHVDLSNASKL